MKTKYVMTSDQLTEFLLRHGLSEQEFAELLGVTQPAVMHWLRERRPVPPTAVRLVKLFDKQPDLMRVF